VDISLVTAAEAARRAGISTRTIARWIQEGRLNRYWWGRGARRLGPRVAMTEVERLLGIVTSNGLDFLLNRPRRGFVEIRDRTTGQPVDTGGAVAYAGVSIDVALPHPDGILALTGGVVGKITRNPKGAWTWSMLHGPQDLRLADWSSVPAADLPRWLEALRRADLDQGGGELELTLRRLRRQIPATSG
jgi:hypothetical protein